MPPQTPAEPPTSPVEGHDETGDGIAQIAEMISHELRGPITTIKGLAATTVRYYDRLPEDEKLEFLSMIEREADRLLEISDEVALALRLDSGVVVPRPRAVDLSALVGEGLELLPSDTREIARRLDPGIEVRVDPELVARAICHVVANADRYSPPGEAIEIRGHRADDAASLEIEDQGPGIPQERRAEVFARFARWRPAGYEDRQGTGLGLFISRGLVRACGGEIEIDGGSEGGTIVRIRLPLED